MNTIYIFCYASQGVVLETYPWVARVSPV